MPNFDNEQFARSLKVKRAERDWTQADLADATGLSLASISHYESCKTIPTFDVVVKIASAFGCSVTDFQKETV